MRKIKWTNQAMERFLEIRSSRVQRKILEGLNDAKRFPQMFPSGKSKHYRHARALVERPFPFVLLYKFDDISLTVIAIYHQRQRY